VAKVIRERLGDAAPKVPSRVAPNLLVRAMSLVDGGIRPYVSDLGKRQWISSAKARQQLGWAPRPIEDSIEDTARALV
jgi:dihydroflavonol-4-reductase